jgi:capsular exopolysaccharide synthesis family protein
MVNDSLPANDEINITAYLDVLLRRRWIVAGIALLVFSVGAAVTFTTKPVFKASTLLVIEKERATTTGGNSSMVENSNEDYYHTQYKLLQSRTLMEKVFKQLKLDTSAEFSGADGLRNLQSSVYIQPVPRSRLVYVNVESEDRGLAARISNLIAETFVKQNLANQLFISKEVLQALKISGEKANFDSLPDVVKNPLIQSLKMDLAKLRSEFAQISQRYTAKHPAYVSAKSNLVALQKQIQTETDRVVSSLKTELSGQLKGNNVRIIDPAIPADSPIRPKPLINLSVGAVIGLMIGVIFAFIVEMLDQSVRSQEDVEHKLGKPFLGIVPQTQISDGKAFDALTSKELSLTSEAFRNLRTMVDFAGVGGKSKALLVSSSVQGEGKTHVAANLAVALSQLGESVLLIDGDLRRPNLHRVFRISAEKGLSDYLLSGRRAEDANHLLTKTEIPGLSLLPCGPRPPNPSELLNTPRLGALVEWAREHYDRVIVDCTPMYPINDTLLWGRHISSCVFVVRFGATRTPLIRNAGQKLEAGAIKMLGVAINAAKAGGLAYSSYGYYYQQYYQEGDRTTVRSA